MLIAVWLFFAVLVAIYAARRGRSGIGWFILAAIISPLLAFLLCLALGPLKSPAAANEPSPTTYVKCPDCRELVLYDARVCKHCGAKLVPLDVPPGPALSPPQSPASNFQQVWQRNKAVIIVLVVIGLMAVASMSR